MSSCPVVAGIEMLVLWAWLHCGMAVCRRQDEISREAAASYIRNAFERFQKLGASTGPQEGG